jgi:hypothetical protein
MTGHHEQIWRKRFCIGLLAMVEIGIFFLIRIISGSNLVALLALVAWINRLVGNILITQLLSLFLLFGNYDFHIAFILWILDSFALSALLFIVVLILQDSKLRFLTNISAILQSFTNRLVSIEDKFFSSLRWDVIWVWIGFPVCLLLMLSIFPSAVFLCVLEKLLLVIDVHWDDHYFHPKEKTKGEENAGIPIIFVHGHGFNESEWLVGRLYLVRSFEEEIKRKKLLFH